MERIFKKCQKSGVPQWVASIMVVAAKMKDDKLRRKMTYKMLWKKLWAAGIGKQCADRPTYVYPDGIKSLIRSIFPKGISNFPDPNHEKVVRVTMEDLFLVEAE